MATERNDSQPRSTSNRGFASMDPARQREIASKGGKAAHEKGTAHEFNSAEARAAGQRAHEKGTAHEFSSEEAREAGRKGGKSSRRTQAQQPPQAQQSHQPHQPQQHQPGSTDRH